jgi:hypothetical protein
VAHSSACERSRAPKSKCRCSCGGALHGIAQEEIPSDAALATAPAPMPQLREDERQRWNRLLATAAEVQSLLSGAVLVGGTAAALHAGHRLSWDADHVMADLQSNFDAILARLEKESGWKTARRRAPVLILGSFHGVEQGIRQLRRRHPIDAVTLEVAPGRVLRIPTAEEIVRIKGFLVVQRNTVRDFLDVVAVADKLGVECAARILLTLDDFYEANRGSETRGFPVATQLIKQLAEPNPVDKHNTDLRKFRGIDPRWASWDAVVEKARQLAVAVVNCLDERAKTGGGMSRPQNERREGKTFQRGRKDVPS